MYVISKTNHSKVFKNSFLTTDGLQPPTVKYLQSSGISRFSLKIKLVIFILERELKTDLPPHKKTYFCNKVNLKKTIRPSPCF